MRGVPTHLTPSSARLWTGPRAHLVHSKTLSPRAGLRTAGDEYSWTATNSMFLRYFGGGEDKPEVAEAIQRADTAAERLASSFADMAVGKEEDEGGKYSKEAVAKLVANH